jgi:Protein of unknown function (DUF2637)
MTNPTGRLRAGGYFAATLVMLCVAIMSWSGLFGWARHILHWAPLAAGMVPVSLDVAALTCALLALDTVSKNEPAMAYRTLTAVFVGLSAFVNFRYRLASHNIAEQVFFPTMSVLAYLMIDATIRKYRRDVRRERTGRAAREAPEPLSRYGLLVWVPVIGHPIRAFRAASAELAARIPEPAVPEPPRFIVITELSQSDAIRHAIGVTDSQDPAVISAWLADNGRPVARQRISDVLRRDGLNGGKHRLEALDGGRADETA